MKKYKSLEEIRKENGMTQGVFAEYLGVSWRTYLARLQGTQPKITLAEVIKAAELNGGELNCNTELGNYDIKVVKR